ncbi:hypothetical protein [Shimia marina]|uniref:Uncharacterized protein n=1 Tax=Shimia marina TaxID=321267 RepID=A0A0N7LSP1_9RHOB|nr:hypothetical protein [Shimia marina]CUH54164.1 hypothetical protein SHM7688_03634 [Shimia marina]SFD96902.1 hypothetical protein SAMN04488037_10444 [Shimia marina]
MSTALDKFQRLEAMALWRDTPEAQRRDVIVSLGDATLVIKDTNDRALAHWSLPAVRRQNSGTLPAVFFPDGDEGETIEIGEDHLEVIEAIEQLRKAVARPTKNSGRLRKGVIAATTLGILGLGVFWLPGALVNHALRVVPNVARQTIGQDMMQLTTRLTGQHCRSTDAIAAVDALQKRLKVRVITVIPSALREAVALPGNIVLLGRDAVEDYEEPDVAAGFVVAAQTASPDPLRGVLESGGISASLRLLTSGTLPEALLVRHLEDLFATPPRATADETLIAAFEERRVRLKPYALAMDPSGESTLPLIEAAPFTEELPEPVLSDRYWVALQGICGS